MKSFKKYLIGIGVLITLVFVGSYAYNQVGYKLSVSDVEKIAYQNAGVTKSKVVSQTLMRLDLKQHQNDLFIPLMLQQAQLLTDVIK